MEVVGDRVELFLSRWKMVAMLAFIAPPSLLGLAVGILEGYAGGWMVGILGGALSALIAWSFVGAGRPYAIVDRSGIVYRKPGVRVRYEDKVAWEDVERVVCGAVHRRRSTGHFLEIYVRGDEDWEPMLKGRGESGSVALGLSAMKGNSLDLVDRIAEVVPIAIEHEEQDGLLEAPEVVRKAD